MSAAISQSVLMQETKTDSLMSNILVPIDLSDRSADTARFALQFARSLKTRVTLLHIERPPEGDLFRIAEAARWVEERMAGFLPQSAHDPNVQRVVRVDPDIAGAILGYAAADDADLIVMATHRSGVIHRALLGSPGAKVLREASCPVWTAFQTAVEPPGDWFHPERILCAAATASEGDEVLAWASQLASQLNARLCVAWTRRGLEEEPDEIEQVQKRYRVDSETVLDSTDVPEALRKTVSGQNAGLLVIGRSALHSQPMLRPDAYEIVRKVRCPVVRL